MHMDSLVQFGAGNIGRSFIGELFSRAGYHVTFVDIDERVVRLINKGRRYRVVVKEEGVSDREVLVTNIAAIDGRNHEAVAEALADARLAATAVGKSALPLLAPVIAAGIRRRFDGSRPNPPPLDIILAENARDAADILRTRLADHLPPGYPLDERVGFVRTSIGKMVPIMKQEDLARDPLLVFAEPYNRLIVDGRGFLSPLPEIEGLEPVANIAAYVDRKLFIHNLGHAATAYLGYRHDPTTSTIAEAIRIPEVFEGVVAAMRQSAAALVRAYPDDFDDAALEHHIQDLLGRFANRALGDTIYRVGRDVPRKLGRDDRLIGAILLAEEQGVPWDAIAEVVASAFLFRATDPEGRLYAEDAHFLEEELADGPTSVLTTVARLDPATERHIIDGIVEATKRAAGS